MDFIFERTQKKEKITSNRFMEKSISLSIYIFFFIENFFSFIIQKYVSVENCLQDDCHFRRAKDNHDEKNLRSVSL